MEPFITLGISLGLGLLIGRQRERAGIPHGGIRTFPLVCLFGTFCGMLGGAYGPWPIVAGIIAIFGTLAIENRMANRTRRIWLAALALVASTAWTSAADNTLTEQERKDGWVLLFDGRTTNGWMSTKTQPLPSTHVQDGSLNPHPCEYMLVHEKVWENYQLSLDFKISPKCNSGVFIRTFPLIARPGKDIGFNGIEIAIDDTKTAGFHDTGAIYDLVKPTANAMKPAGEWNHLVITSDRHLLSVELNGTMVSRMNLDEWREVNKRSDGTAHKFDVAYMNHPRKGHIGLQDHGSDCWFKNIKLLPLK